VLLRLTRPLVKLTKPLVKPTKSLVKLTTRIAGLRMRMATLTMRVARLVIGSMKVTMCMMRLRIDEGGLTMPFANLFPALARTPNPASTRSHLFTRKKNDVGSGNFPPSGD
jgi:hypothetical protein